MLTAGQKGIVLAVLVGVNVAIVGGGLAVGAFRTPVPIAAAVTVGIVSAVVGTAVLRR
jgi:hypothetical protein